MLHIVLNEEYQSYNSFMQIPLVWMASIFEKENLKNNGATLTNEWTIFSTSMSYSIPLTNSIKKYNKCLLQIIVHDRK